MNRLYILPFIIILILGISPLSFAKTQGVFTNTGIGGRSSVFGESFVAIADDASAIYWNPAGISKLTNRYNATASRINLFSRFTSISDINYNFFSFVFSDQPWGLGISVDWLGTNRIIKSNEYGNIESLHSSYAEYKISPSVSRQLWKLGSVGISGNYFRIDTEYISHYGGITLGWLSTRWIVKSGEQYECWLRFGSTARNIFDTIDSPTRRYTFASAFGGGFEKWGMLNLATAYSRGPSQNSSKLVTSVEYAWDEWKPQYGVYFSIYGCFEYYLNTSVKFWKAGGGIGSGSLFFDYSFERHSFLENTHRVALNLKLSRHETAIFIRKLQEGKEVDTDNTFETADNIVIHIDVSDDMHIEGVETARPKLICFEKIGTEQLVEKLEMNYRDMQMDDRNHVHYILNPKEHQLYPGTYIVSVFSRGRKLQSAEFLLSYNQTAERIVGEAYKSFFSEGNLDKAKNYLLDAARAEQNYPNTYHIAGLISEASGDFIGAQKCYLKAFELSGGQKIRHLETEMNLKKLAELDYLQRYAESQKRQGKPGIGLCEELEAAVNPH